MKIRHYLALAAAITLFGCKEETKTTTTEETKIETEAVAAPTAATPDSLPGVVEDAAVPEDGSVLLRLNYPKGFRHQLNYVMNTTATNMKMDMMVAVDVKVASVKAGANPVFTFEGEVKSVKMDSDAMGQKISYDSSKKAADLSPSEKAMDARMRKMINEPMTFSLDGKGKVVSKAKFKNTNENEPFDLNNSQIEFSDKPVKVGDSWTTQTENKQFGKKVTNTYTVQKITDKTVTVASRSVIPPVKEIENKEVTLAGSYVIDRATGMVLQGSIGGKMPSMGAELKITFTGKKM